VLRYVKKAFVFYAAKLAYPFGKGSARVNKWQIEERAGYF
jgi:hypothetical protein